MSFGRSSVGELVDKAAFQIEFSVSDVIVERRGDFDGPVILNVKVEVAEDDAVRTDYAGDELARFVPAVLVAQAVECAHESQGKCRKFCPTLFSVDAGRLQPL